MVKAESLLEKMLYIQLPRISVWHVLLLGNVLVTILKSRVRKYSWRRVRRGPFHKISGSSSLEIIILILSSHQESINQEQGIEKSEMKQGQRNYTIELRLSYQNKSSRL